MLKIRNKILIHFCSNSVNVYSLREGILELQRVEEIIFDEQCVNDILLKAIDTVLKCIKNYITTFNNRIVRIYATGIFQTYTQKEQVQLVNSVYVNHGVYFNIVQSDLEKFYLEKSKNGCSSRNMMEGILQQEFRKVVICGSFQNHLSEIDDLMNILHKRDIEVLSPWTTEVVPETIGTDFVLLRGQKPLKNYRDAWTHKYEHMEKFKLADAIIVCNPNGTIGIGTMFEFGFMVAISKRIIFTEAPNNWTIPFPYEIGLNLWD